jgi:uncharacterized membrane protein YkvA (DUF1232 family)
MIDLMLLTHSATCAADFAYSVTTILVEELFVDKNSFLNSGDQGFFGELWQQAKLVVQLMLDRNVPIYLKLLPAAAVAYLLFPFDFLPDVVPGIGQLDDITILLIGAKVFIELAPSDVVARYLGRLKTQDEAVGSGKQKEEDEIIEGIIVEDNGEGE